MEMWGGGRGDTARFEEDGVWGVCELVCGWGGVEFDDVSVSWEMRYELEVSLCVGYRRSSTEFAVRCLVPRYGDWVYA